MADKWQAAVAGGDADKLSDLVFLATGSKPERAVSLLRSCVQLLEKKTATSSSSSEGACAIVGVQCSACKKKGPVGIIGVSVRVKHVGFLGVELFDTHEHGAGGENKHLKIQIW